MLANIALEVLDSRIENHPADIASADDDFNDIVSSFEEESEDL